MPPAGSCESFLTDYSSGLQVTDNPKLLLVFLALHAEVSKKRSNFRIRQFKEKRYCNIAANLMLNAMVSFIILLIARTARIACPDRHTHTQENYCNLAAHARRGLTIKRNALRVII